MALADPITFGHHGNQVAQIVRPVQIGCGMVVAILSEDDAGVAGINGADNSGSSINSPDTQIATVSRRIIKTAGAGTVLRASMRYDDGLSGITDPVINVVGRMSEQDVFWRKLFNKAGSYDATLATAATDLTSGTFDFTDPHPDNNAWDIDGCDEILIGVKTALAATGDVTNADLLVWLI